jgi:hypothetical protein
MIVNNLAGGGIILTEKKKPYVLPLMTVIGQHTV